MEDCKLAEDEKNRYIGLIQAQMSINELFCYMVNVMDYYYRVDGALALEKTIDNAYINILFRRCFFEDLFRKQRAIELKDRLYDQLNSLYFKEFDYDCTLYSKGTRDNYELEPFEPGSVK